MHGFYYDTRADCPCAHDYWIHVKVKERREMRRMIQPGRMNTAYMKHNVDSGAEERWLRALGAKKRVYVDVSFRRKQRGTGKKNQNGWL